MYVYMYIYIYVYIYIYARPRFRRSRKRRRVCVNSTAVGFLCLGPGIRFLMRNPWGRFWPAKRRPSLPADLAVAKKTGAQNGPLVNGAKDQNLRNPSS